MLNVHDELNVHKDIQGLLELIVMFVCHTMTLDGQARELATPGLRSTVTSAQGQLAGLEEVLKKVAAATGKMVARTLEEERDMTEFARDLGNIGSSASVFGDNDFFFESSKEVAR